MKVSGLSLLAVFLVWLLGCQGVNPAAQFVSSASTPSSGQGGTPSQSQSPHVAEIKPSPGATCVSPSDAVTATFTEALDPSTVNSLNFFIPNATSTVSYNADRLTVTLTPTGPLQENTAYTVMVTTGIAGSAGQHLAANFQSSFTTGPCQRQSAREFVYSTNSSGGIFGFAMDQHTGALAPIPGSPFAAEDGPDRITSDPSGHHVFVLEKTFQSPSINCEQAKGVLLSETVDPHSGVLRLADKVNLDGFCPAGLVTDPQGKNLYVGMMTTGGLPPPGSPWGEIQAFAIGANGSLKEITGSPFLMMDVPGAFAMHPGSKLLYATTNDDRNGIVVFDRDTETGALGLPKTVGKRGWAKLAITPSGTLMVAENASIIDQITLFNISPATGELTPQVPIAAWQPWAVSVDPLGKFVAMTIASLGTPGEVAIYRIDDSRSGMTQILGTPAAAGNGPFDVTFDPEGLFVYSIAAIDGAIRGFSFNQSSGELKPVPDSPFKAGATPLNLTIVRHKGAIEDLPMAP
jgi:6-phosphogluconolactonase (cycloisomerase 2 family)